MSKVIRRVEILSKPWSCKALFVLSLVAFTSFFFESAASKIARAQVIDLPVTQFRVGEKLVYSVSFERFSDVAFVETDVVSRGLLGGKDAIEIHSKIKTFDLVSAAYHLVDETRITFAAVDSGLPLYTSRTQNYSGLPKETISSYLTVPTSTYDLLTMFYRIRQSGGSGEMPLIENGKSYNVAFQSTANERVKTGAGEFDTVVTLVQSDYLSEIGVKDLRINISTDEARVPVMIRLKTAKGEFKASVSSIQMNVSQPPIVMLPTPMSTPTPRPAATPAPTPTPYIENQPLARELSFPLGESLEYQITTAGRPLAAFTLQARERKLFLGADSLLLDAVVTKSEPGNPLFTVNDFVRAQVDPETLGPQQINIKFTGALAGYNQTAQFDRLTSYVAFGAADRVEVPVGTHSIISLLYAIRSFNLKPSKDTTNPVNDTRVAVFWENRPYVFTLRPAFADLITQQGETVSAQLVTVKTGNLQLDQLNIKIWLSNDELRLPLRISAGIYQADLVSNSILQIK
ncbi:MAG: DUF3108 domain-containing protein [Saprospiraceae bacterium]|nr:DUF3108 domain-containing protein [Pyrinomonadaceae bacterium]